MPTFQETRDWLRGHCPVVMEEDNYVVLDQGKQRVRVVHKTTLGESWLAVASVIDEQDLIEPESALEYNRTNGGVGALAVENGRIQLRAMLPLHDLSWETLDHVIRYVAEESARVRALARPQPVLDPKVFSHYAA